MVAYTFICIVLIHCLFKVTTVDCCPSRCRCANSSLYCFYQGISTDELVAMSSSIPADTKKLYLSGNEITHFPIQNFSHLKKLRYLSLSFNQLSNMPLNVSMYFPALTELYLTANRIDGIPSLHGYENVEILDLNENKIQHLPDFSFKEMRSLKELLLGKNQIRNITSGVFYGLEKLEKLKLNNNGIKHIDEMALHSTPHLKEIYLHVNKLSQIQNNLFNKLKDLETLYLYNNAIKRIGTSAFSNLNIHVIYLNSNKISKLSTASFNSIRIKEKIYMGDNEFLCNCQLFMSIKVDGNFKKLLHEDKIDLGECISRNRLSKLRITSLNNANCTICDLKPCREGLTCIVDDSNHLHHKCIDTQSTTATTLSKVTLSTMLSTNKRTNTIVSTAAANLIGEQKLNAAAEIDSDSNKEYLYWVIAIVCALIGCAIVALVTWLLYKRSRRREFEVNAKKHCTYDKVHYSSDTLADVTIESTDCSPVDV